MRPTSLPPFSVLLPVYAGDRPEHLVAAFRSVVDQQSLRPDQVVLVQDGPLGVDLQAAFDRLAQSELTSVTVLRLEQNGGLAAALEAGLAVAEHEIVARMDADDLSREDRFEIQIPVVAGGADLVGSTLHEFQIVEGEMRILGRRVPPLDPVSIRARLPFADPFHHPTVVFRRSAVEAAGGYQTIGPMEDYWLFARMIVGGSSVVNVPDALVRYRIDAGAYSRRGGFGLLRAELRLQRLLRAVHVTSRAQYVRNVIVRGGYRLVPMLVRRVLYRRVIARGFDDI